MITKTAKGATNFKSIFNEINSVRIISNCTYLLLQTKKRDIFGFARTDGQLSGIGFPHQSLFKLWSGQTFFVQKENCPQGLHKACKTELNVKEGYFETYPNFASITEVKFEGLPWP